MLNAKTEPRLTEEGGVAFAVQVDFVNRECYISNDALAKLCRLNGLQTNPMETFRAFEATINGVARRLVAANVPGTPLLLGPNTFR